MIAANIVMGGSFLGRLVSWADVLVWSAAVALDAGVTSGNSHWSLDADSTR